MIVHLVMLISSHGPIPATQIIPIHPIDTFESRDALDHKAKQKLTAETIKKMVENGF